MTVPELWANTGPLDDIAQQKRTVMKNIDTSMNSRYLTNHEDQYNHIRIPISFIDSCIVFTVNISHFFQDAHFRLYRLKDVDLKNVNFISLPSLPRFPFSQINSQSSFDCN